MKKSNYLPLLVGILTVMSSFHTIPALAVNPPGTGATNAIVFGSGAEASNSSSVVLGNSLVAKGNNAVVIGSKNGRDENGKWVVPSGESINLIGSSNWIADTDGTNKGKFQYATAIGVSNAAAYQAFAIGRWNNRVSFVSNSEGKADPRNSVTFLNNYQNDIEKIKIGNLSAAIGTYNVSPGDRANAIGTQNYAQGRSSLALGGQNWSEGSSSAAIGVLNYAESLYGLAVGYRNNSRGQSSVAIGSYAEAGATDAGYALALGNYAQAKKEASISIGRKAKTENASAVAIGSEAVAKVDSGVALGEGSVAQTASGKKGYDQNSKTAATGAAWVSTKGAVAVGNGTTVTRQITGLAAGTDNTDAVNVAQLKDLAWNYRGDKGQNSSLLTDTVAFLGTTGEIDTEVSAGTIRFKLSDAWKQGREAIKQSLASNTSALNQIKNDIYTNNKLKGITFTGNQGSATRTLGESLAIQGAPNGMIETAIRNNTLTIDWTAATKAAWNNVNALANSSLQQWKAQIDGRDIKTISKTNNTFNLITGKNIVLENSSGGARISTSMTPAFTSVTATDKIEVGPANAPTTLINSDGVKTNKVATDVVQVDQHDYITNAGIDANNKKITNVADGTIGAGSKDAVNGSQLHTTNQNVADNTANIATNTGNIATNTGNIATNTGNIATNTANIADNAGKIATNTANIADNAGKIATNTNNIATNTGNIAANTANIATLQRGWTLSDGTNSTGIVAQDTLTVRGDDYITAAVTQDGDALTIQASQKLLKTIQDSSDAAQNFTVGADTNATGNGINITKTNNHFDIKGVANGDITTSQDGNTILIDLSAKAKEAQKDLDNQVQGNTNALGGGANYDKDKDTYTPPTYTMYAPGVAVQTHSVGEALAHLDQGFKVTATTAPNTNGVVSGTSESAVRTNDLVTYLAGKNMAITQNGNSFTFGVVERPVFTGVTATEKIEVGPANAPTTQINSDGVTTNKVTTDVVRVDQHDYITNAGIDANNKKITNVADGTIGAGSKDAVNGSQLHTTNQNVADNANNIATNTGNIATNTGNIATNTAAIADHAGKIATNTNNIADNAGKIATNTNNIATNTGNIAANTANIATLQRGWTLSDGTNSTGIVAQDTLTVRGDDYITAAVTPDGDALTIQASQKLLQKIQDSSDAAQNFTVGADTNTTGNGINITKTNNHFDIKGVANGDITTSQDGNTIRIDLSAKAKEAQKDLDNQVQGNTNALGGGANYNKDTDTYTPPTYTMYAPGGPVQTHTVGEALAHLDQGFKVTATTAPNTNGVVSGTSESAVRTNDLVTYLAGKNMAITQNGNSFTFGVVERPVFTGVTATDKIEVGPADAPTMVIGKDGISITGADGKTGKIGVSGQDGKITVTDGDGNTSRIATEKDLETKADTNLGNLTDDGKNVVKDEARKAVTVEAAANSKIIVNTVTDDVNHKTTYTVDVDLSDYLTKSGVQDVATYNSNLVYTDANGNRLKKANDGQFYPADQVGADGAVTGGAAAVPTNQVRLNTVGADGNTNTAIQVGNVADATNDHDAVNLGQLNKVKESILNGEAGGSGKDGKGLNAIKDDIYENDGALKGMSFVANDGTLKKTLGESVQIVGKEQDVYADGDYSDTNVKTKVDGDKLHILLNDKMDLKEVTVQDGGVEKTVLGKDGISITGADGKTGKIGVSGQDGKITVTDAAGNTSRIATEKDLETKADTNLGNLTDDGKNVVKDEARKAVTVEAAANSKIIVNTVTDDVNHKTTYTVDVDLSDYLTKSGVQDVATYNSNLVYTDADGNRLKKANDGQFYPADQVGADGAVTGGAAAVPTNQVRLNTVGADGNTKTAIQVGNVADATNDHDAVNLGQLNKVKESILNGEAGGSGKDGKGLNAIKDDIYENDGALKGMSFVANDGTLKKTLGESVQIVGKEQDVYADGDYSDTNVKTKVDGDKLHILLNDKMDLKEVTVQDGGVEKTVLGKDGISITGADGKTGKIGVSGQDGKITVTDGDGNTSRIATEKDLETKADTNLGNLTDDGKNVIKDEAISAVQVAAADSSITIEEDNTVAHVKTYKVKANLGDYTKKDASNLTDDDVEKWQEKLGNGTVVENDKRLVNGGTVYQALQNLQKEQAGIDLEQNQRLDSLDHRVGKMDTKISETAALNAALSGLKPIDYDPEAPGQIMAAVGHYDGKSALALGYGRYQDEDTLIHGGLAYGGDKLMANIGITKRIGEGGGHREDLRADNAQLRAELEEQRQMILTLMEQVKELQSK